MYRKSLVSSAGLFCFGFYCIGERNVCEEAFTLRPDLFSHLGPLVLQPFNFTPPLDVYPAGSAASFGVFLGYGAGPIIDGYAAASFHTFIISTTEDGVEPSATPTVECPSQSMAMAAYGESNLVAPQQEATEICMAPYPSQTPPPTITPTATITPSPTPTLTPSPTATQDIGGCIVAVLKDRNGYAHAVDARTDRFRVDSDSSAPIIPITPIQTFPENTQLRLEGRYTHNGFEEYVYQVTEYKPMPSLEAALVYNSSGWQTLNQPLWIAINASSITYLNGVESYCDALPEINDPSTQSRSSQPGYEDETIIEDIRDYGVEPRQETGITWDRTANELNELLAGIQRTAQALHYLAQESSQHASFREHLTASNIIDYMVFVRGNRLNCLAETISANPGDGANLGKVTCGHMQDQPPWQPQGKLKAQAVIHELGHIFDAWKNGALHNAVDGIGIVILGCDNQTKIMGRDNNNPDWERGGRGWGSGPSWSAFQLNPTSLPGNTDQTVEVEEAMADMFLNWVYRRTTDQPGQAPTANICTDGIHQIRGSWQGFLNVNWQTGEDDSLVVQPDILPVQSGNSRYWWMEQKMDALVS